MERTISVEEKIRRAEEIYERRRLKDNRTTVNVNIKKEKKNFKLLRKIVIQIIICSLIYFIVNTMNNNEYILEGNFIENINMILAHDTNFGDIYNKIKDNILGVNLKENKVNNENNNAENGDNIDENIENKGIGGIEILEIEKNEKLLVDDKSKIENISFIKPIEGIITSKFRIRDSKTEGIPKNHTGIDIAADMGTKIKSSTEGEVVLVSEEGDYGKHIKIQIGEVSVIYAHCNQLYVKQGELVKQGQEIAEVGSTGNSTGPHLHFEIRLNEKEIDPQLILEL